MATERGIPFSGAMILALRGNEKSVTRRIIKPQPKHLQYHRHRGVVTYEGEHRMWCWRDLVMDNLWDFPRNEDRQALAARCPYGVAGDVLYVRELLRRYDDGAWYYDVDGMPLELEWPEHQAWGQRKQDYCPSIHMPRWAARDHLRILDVEPEPLNRITPEDVALEGVPSEHPGPNGGHGWEIQRRYPGWRPTAIRLFSNLWDHLNARRGFPFASNPFVWRIEFRRMPEDEVRAWKEELTIRDTMAALAKSESACGWGYE